MPIITVIGLASGKKIKDIDCGHSLEMNLMEFLRQNNIPIASSCLGMGVCEKCVINQNLLSCMLSVKEYTEQFQGVPITVSYL